MGKYFHALNYSMGDEDSTLELELLPRAAHIVAVAGCGGRVLPLLAKQPQRLVCVDILPEQLALTRLRLALLQHCEREPFLKFLGYRDGMSASERQQLFDRLDLPGADRDILVRLFDAAGWRDPVYLGRFERMLQTLHTITRLMTGSAARGLFDTADLPAQREYYRSRFPHWRWKAVVALLGNSAVLNSLLYRGDFPRNNLGISSFRRYSQIFDTLFTQLPARHSFFLQMVFFGRLKHEAGFPAECREDVFDAARRAIGDCAIELVQADIVDTVARSQAVDFVSISDVLSFLPDDAAHQALQRLRPGLAPQARVVSRGHLRVVRPDTTGYDDISAEHRAVMDRESTQLWQVQVYQHAG